MAIHYDLGAVGLVLALAVGLPLSGCDSSATKSAASKPGSGASEVNPAGDIPDTQAFVPFTVPDGTFTVSVPEGWARSFTGSATVFTDKTNSVHVEAGAQPSAPTIESITAVVVPAIASDSHGYQPGSVSVVQRKAGPAVLATYKVTSAPNPVTGKSIVDAVERYEFWRAGHIAVITLSGPAGADNADPWSAITNSLRWQ